MGRTVRARVQDVINHDRTAGALPAQVPRFRQVQRLRFDKQPLQRVLVLGEILDARPLAAGQTMPRQVAGNHRKTLIQRPLDHMPIQPCVIVETVEQQQRRLRPRWPPDLADHLVTAHLETTQTNAQFASGKIQTVEALISLRFCRQRLPLGQGPQAGTQNIRIEVGRHG